MSQAPVFYFPGSSSIDYITFHITHSLLFLSSRPSWSLISQQTLLSTVSRLLQHNEQPKISEKQGYSHIVLLHIHKSMTDSIDLQSIAVEFVKRNDRRLRYFGHY